MKLVIPKEITANEQRIAIVPQAVATLSALGLKITIEQDLGSTLGFSNAAYEQAGASICKSAKKLYKEADIILQINTPTKKQLKYYSQGTIHISMVNPLTEPAIVQAMLTQELKVLSLAMVPRISSAQKMDVLSSQYNIAGYAAVIMAATHIKQIFPMLTTAAGTITPVKVLIIGAAVAGLQAIATAKRLGAVVTAYDLRPEVEEQITSLGAKFAKLDANNTLAKLCTKSDIIISTAQIFGKPAPTIITDAMLASMQSGSVIVDLAASSGGNVTATEPNKIITTNGITIIGLTNLPSEYAITASNMFANNAVNFISHLWNSDTKQFNLQADDPITKSCLLNLGDHHAGS